MNRGVQRFPRREVYRVYDPDMPPLNPSPLNDEFEVDSPSVVGAPPGWTSVGTLTPTSVVRLGQLTMTRAGEISNNTVAIDRGTLPVGPFTVATKMTLRNMVRYNACGIYVRSSVSGRALNVNMFTNSSTHGDTHIAWERWNNWGSRNSTGSSPRYDHYAYLRLTSDGTTLNGDYSMDGIEWMRILSEAVSSWFTGGNLPDRFGLKMTPFDPGTHVTSFSFIRYFPQVDADIGRFVTREV